MCGSPRADTPGSLPFICRTESAGLRRNCSTSSSSAANNHFAASSLTSKSTAEYMPHEQPDDRAAQTDIECGVVPSVVNCLDRIPSLLNHTVGSLEPVEPSVPPTQLLLGTSAGLFVVNLKTRDIQLLGLQECTVGQVSYHDGTAYACCPVPDTSNMSMQQQHAAAAVAGLYGVNLRRPSHASGPDSTYVQAAQKLWDGNARCAAVTAPANSSSGSMQPRIYVGTQPAELLFSDDMGSAWTSTGLSQAPASKHWYHRSPPYEPGVRSISCCSNSRRNGVESPRFSTGSGYSWGTDCSAPPQQLDSPEILVGVEVGGVYSCNPSHHPPTPADYTDSSSNSSCSSQVPWTESSQGLCKDIQHLQRDPWSSKRLYAVGGSGSLPGGVYRSRGQGHKWKRLFGYRYPVSMAISPYEKGRMLLVSADKPPAIGTNIFESIDGGRHWLNITDDIHEALLGLTNHALGLFEHTPVCMFVPGGLVVACATGHVFRGQVTSGGGCAGWQLLAEVPAGINCMCLTDESVAPASMSRM